MANASLAPLAQSSASLSAISSPSVRRVTRTRSAREEWSSNASSAQSARLTIRLDPVDVKAARLAALVNMYSDFLEILSAANHALRELSVTFGDFHAAKLARLVPPPKKEPPLASRALVVSFPQLLALHRVLTVHVTPPVLVCDLRAASMYAAGVPSALSKALRVSARSVSRVSATMKRLIGANRAVRTRPVSVVYLLFAVLALREQNWEFLTSVSARRGLLKLALVVWHAHLIHLIQIAYVAIFLKKRFLTPTSQSASLVRWERISREDCACLVRLDFRVRLQRYEKTLSVGNASQRARDVRSVSQEGERLAA